MRNTPMPPRAHRMPRGESRLTRSAIPRRSPPVAPAPWSVPLAPAAPAEGRKGLPPVSAKRRKENRERAAMADRLWPDRREGTVMCIVSFCTKPADDLHEILPRGRGGSITDEENTVPTCRQHNHELTESPDWGYREGLLKHDGVCCQGRRVCSRFAEDGAA